VTAEDHCSESRSLGLATKKQLSPGVGKGPGYFPSSLPKGCLSTMKVAQSAPHFSFTFVSFIRDLPQVNEMGTNGHIIDFVRVSDLDLYPLAQWGEHFCEDYLLVPERLIAAFLYGGLPLSSGRRWMLGKGLSHPSKSELLHC